MLTMNGGYVRQIVTVLFAIFLLAGCASGPGGELLPNGTITPCGGHHTDPQACGNATFNARVIGKVQVGQSKQDVRAIMQHDPERREISANVETWSYITDYPSELVTEIVFTDGKVTGLKQAPWHTD